MNYETIRNLDLTVVLSIAPPTASTADATGATPRLFGAEPAAAEGKDRTDIQALVPKIAAILETLQKAHLDGRLQFGDLQAMQQLELWYSQLKAEAPSQAKPKGKSR